MPIIQITVGDGRRVYYSLNNGVTISEFEDKELYSVPDYAAAHMMERGWAKLANLADTTGQKTDPPESKPASSEPAPPISEAKKRGKT